MGCLQGPGMDFVRVVVVFGFRSDRGLFSLRGDLIPQRSVHRDMFHPAVCRDAIVSFLKFIYLDLQFVTTLESVFVTSLGTK